MLIFIVGNRQLRELRRYMSIFTDKFYPLLEQVANGAAEHAETKEAINALNMLVADLTARLVANEANDADSTATAEELKAAVLALTEKLAEATPPEA